MTEEQVPMSTFDMRRPRPLTVVIKLGTSSIVDEKTHEPLLPIVTLIVDTAVKLRKDGHKVVIVSSGAIGVGLRRMDVDRRPKHLAQLQALAAIGQCRLISLWDSLFGHMSQPVAQILLTRSDIADRTRYINAQNTLRQLLDMGVIPIVNENDTVAVSEIKFGDNDTLSAITSAMIHADLLFLMTDVDCLYDKNPRHNPDAKPIEVVHDISVLEADVSSAGSALGTGGMSTKIIAAKLGTSAGVTTIITRSSNPGNILSIVRYLQGPSPSRTCTPAVTAQGKTEQAQVTRHNSSSNGITDGTRYLNLDAPSSDTGKLTAPPLHTRFVPSTDPMSDRDFWLLHTPSAHGTIFIDKGAWKALQQKHNLLPPGVVHVAGKFAASESVKLVVVERPKGASPGREEKILYESLGQEVGRALVNYSYQEIIRIKGHQSPEIENILGYADSDYIANRSRIVLFPEDSRPATPHYSDDGKT